MRKIVVKLMGGLGNQMFQFSAAKKIESIMLEECQIEFDTNFLEDRSIDVVHRNFDLSIFNKIDCPVNNSANQEKDKHVINDQNIFSSLNLNLSSLKKDIYLDGFFQKYNLVDDSLKEFFSFDSFYTEIDKKDIAESLMINVRRADYVYRKSSADFHGFLNEKYFYSAFERFSDLNIKNIFVFSDDTDWCKNNINLPNCSIVDHSNAGEKFGNYLRMMSSFRYMIIPNSTFAWWSCWISEKNRILKKVISPGTTLWFAKDSEKSNGLIPDHWEKLEKQEV